MNVTVDGKPIVEVLSTLQEQLQTTNTNQTQQENVLNQLSSKTLKTFEEINIVHNESRDKFVHLTNENIELKKQNELIVLECQQLRKDVVELQNRLHLNPIETK